MTAVHRSGERTLPVAAALALLATGCTVGPDYERPPDIEVPEAFAGASGWQPAMPADAVQRDKWWSMFGDAQLDELASQVGGANFDVQRAEAEFRRMRALVEAARAGLWPNVAFDAGFTRSLTPVGSGGTAVSSARPLTTYATSLSASWEVDLWGAGRRTVEAAVADAQATAADFESARLAAQADLVQDYLLLRVAEGQERLLEDTVRAFERSLELVRNRLAVGTASRADVAQGEAQLENARAQAIDVTVQREQLAHAIAVLVGRPPSAVTLPPGPVPAVFPTVPTGVPSELLQRRPDIAGAERRVASANARVGVAAAAWYPSLTLVGSAGYRSRDLSDWITAPARFWTFGPALVQTLFDAGKRSAEADAARAELDATAAVYRQTVLVAFQEVEDNLSSLQILAREADVQDAAVRASRESVELAQNQYRAGTISFLEVIIVQTAALTNERTAVAVQGRRLLACVQLVRALGGGWNAAALPPATEL
jgi:NodT family efflux transporter outer membrane factor (OMF) lipoprotein